MDDVSVFAKTRALKDAVLIRSAIAAARSYSGMKVIVTGGAGYIGAHVARALAAAGHEPIIVDDLRCATRAARRRLHLRAARREDTAALTDCFRATGRTGVIHLAGYISVGESVRLPDKYWGNNLGAGASLLLACARHPVRAFLFSSTAAVYGNAEVSPIPEAVPLAPTSPYGASKLAFERLLHASAPALRHALGGAALLQRRRRQRRVARRRGACARGASDSARHRRAARRPAGADLRRRLSDRRTAPACATTSTSPIWRPRTCRCSRRTPCRAASASTSAPAAAARCCRSCAAVGARLGIEPRLDIGPRRPGDPASLVADPGALRAHSAGRRCTRRSTRSSTLPCSGSNGVGARSRPTTVKE